MTIAIAATAPELNGQIAMHGARAPFYLLFDEQGNMLEVLANPVVQAEGGAAPGPRYFLQTKVLRCWLQGTLVTGLFLNLRRGGLIMP